MKNNPSKNHALGKIMIGAGLALALASFVICILFVFRMIGTLSGSSPVFPANIGEHGAYRASSGSNKPDQNGGESSKLMQIDPKYWQVYPAAYRVPRPPGDLNYDRICLPQTLVSLSGQCLHPEAMQPMTPAQSGQSPITLRLVHLVQMIGWILVHARPAF